jgi:hypothetical protein
MEVPLKRTIGWLTVWLMLLASWPAAAADSETTAPPSADEQGVSKEKEAAKKKKIPLGLDATLANEVGGGTFTSNEHVRRSSYSISLDMIGHVKLVDQLKLKVRFIASQPVVENYETVTTYKNRTVMADLPVYFTYLYTVPKLKLEIIPELALVFPTSPESQFKGRYVTLRPKLGLGRDFKAVRIDYALYFYKNFDRYTQAAVDTSRVGENVILARYNGNEHLTTDIIATDGFGNVSFGFVNAFTFLFNIHKKLGLTVYYEINNGWTYESYNKDENSSEYADSGRGQRDVQRGIVELAIAVTDKFSILVGTDTITAPKSSDNESFVWPFANFSRYHRQNSVVYLAFALSL